MELLKQLYSIHSPSGNEQRMRKFIKRWIKKHVSNATITTDPIGNIYVTRGKSDTYPCIVSHMDQVQKNHSKDFKAIESADIIFGYSPSQKRQEGLGADDKNGIWCCLKCLQYFNTIKAAFFVQEETGCVGSRNADMDFFNDTRFVLQADRKGSGDLITSIWGDLCSDEFLAAIGFPAYNYKTTSGLTTDVGTLKENGLNVSAVNLSCGYYEPHTDHEITVKRDLMNCLTFIHHIIETCTNTYPHECFGCDEMGWMYYGNDDPYAYDEEYEELAEIINDYLDFLPDTPAGAFYESYSGYFPHLQFKDYQSIINDYNYARTGLQGESDSQA